MKKINSEEEVKKILSTLVNDITALKEGKTKRDFLSLSVKDLFDFKLVESDKKDSKRKPGAPFTTSTLQQE